MSTQNSERTAMDDAYANSKYIPDGEGYYTRWPAAAEAFVTHHPLKELGVVYGPAVRQTYDIFHPSQLAKGTIIFVHGGYWMNCTPRDFSHLAKGGIEAGYAVAMPQYTLAPDARIGDMTVEIARAIAAIAERTAGPLYLAGHSAGGHLVARMACKDMAAAWSGRIKRVMAISPLSDLGPLRQTGMNDTLRIDHEEAQRESPIRHARQEMPVTVWVGGDERPVFRDQAGWLAAAWGCDHVVDEGRHHFDVIEGLQDPQSAMLKTLLS